MGGHSAWRKRVAEGGLAKEGTGGAIARHRPRWGRKGKDLKLNRKGNIAGGNPKKTNKANSGDSGATAAVNSNGNPSINGGAMARRNQAPVNDKVRSILTKWVFVMLSGLFYMYLKKKWTPKESEFPGL
jgi:hypothetical protein